MSHPVKPGFIRKLGLCVLLLTALAAYVYLIPPQNWIIVAGFIAGASICTYIIVSLFFKNLYAVLAGISILMFLSMNALVGFQILNTILLVSFIIGTAIILKNE